jgi:beta-lactam-binding protein with PASTA domain
VQAVTIMAAPPTSAAATTSYLPSGAVTEVLWEGRSPEAERSRRRRGYTAIFLACLIALVAVAFIVRSALSGSGGGATTMPQLVGQTQAAAIQTLKDHHLTVGKITPKYETSDINKGKVIAQTVAPQFQVSRGDSEDFTVSAGIQFVPIPTVKSLPEPAATKTLQDLGFKVGTSIPRVDVTQAPGTVLDITPGEGSKQPKGTQVVLTVVSGMVSVPSVTGLPDQRHATDRLRQFGLGLGNVSTSPSTQKVGSVIAQNPQPGTSVNRDSTVDLVLAAPIPSPSPSPSPAPSPAPSVAPASPSPVVDPASPTVDPASPIP